MSKGPVPRKSIRSFEAIETTQIVAEPAGPAKPERIDKLTVYVPRAAAKRLKQMALDQDRRVNDFLREGVELMLAKYGQPSLAEFGEM
jgi:hypothetical protein